MNAIIEQMKLAVQSTLSDADIELIGELAKAVDASLPSNPEKTVALRKLLESKDCAVRAVIFKNQPSHTER